METKTVSVRVPFLTKETETKKRVRRPVMQVLLARAEGINAKLTKMIGGEPQVSAMLVAEIRRLIDSGFKPPVNKRETIAFETGRSVRIKDKYAKNYLAVYSELELNSMAMDSLEDGNVAVCRTADRNVLAKLRHLEKRE